ncbi:MBL fold metallo-hydrolase [Bacillus marinisedimentorum]|uniref:MBL fold metallo-hydrolase n=1 Tax=Bacillus marinisedimentorum TaxID=1821260 RepID=UPI00087212D5|nr:MBL fold metallo-hydrolase [Bacillus marinisedimentorum]
MENPFEKSFIPVTSVNSGNLQEVAPDVSCFTIQVVNVSMVGHPDSGYGWVLVDAGMPRSADNILKAVKERFGEDRAPEAIILTHGHFDHVGGLLELVEHWGCPVYAHPLEMLYLTGHADYPEPDTSVEGGLGAKMAGMFPNEGIDLGKHVHELPADGTVPGLPDWRWVHTPGHTTGHISLFRGEDRFLIAGDAFITVKQESLFKVLTQHKEISGPPRYLTPDWDAAYESVKKLANLHPAVAITGHGCPMGGQELTTSLEKLVIDFDKIAVPDYGRYVDD